MTNPKQKKIGIDARFYGPIGKGLGRYTQEIVDRITKIDTLNQYIIFLSPDNFKEFQCDNIRIKKILIKSRWYSLAEQIFFPWIIWRAKLDLIHFAHFNVPILTPVKFVVTIHDLILTKFPTERATTLNPIFYRIKDLLYRLVIWLAVKRAKKIIAVSNYTKEDIVRQFKAPEEKIVLIYEGISDFKKPSSEPAEEILSKYGIAKPFLLYVGNAYPHKNLESLIKIFPDLQNYFPEMKLVLVGKEDYFYHRLKKIARDISPDIVFADFVPDQELSILYQEASMYIFPSLYEGFGLPPLEAMAFGCPVASSDRSCLPEILGQAALYFNPENNEEILAAIKNLINNADLRARLASDGKELVKKYSWAKAAEETLKIYLNLL